MSITVDKADLDRRPDEFAPMISAEVRDALRRVHHAATPLYLEVMSLPDGFAPSDDWLRARLGWTVTRLRTAKHGLIVAGLYLDERIQVAAGHWIRACRYVTNVVQEAAAAAVAAASSQVQPSVGLATVGPSALIPPPREKKERGGILRRHSRSTCKREAAGLPCSQCAEESGRAKSSAEKSSGATIPTSHPAYQSVAEVMREEQEECEHGAVPHRCAFCRRR